jgi:hypothetical protein
MPGEQRSTPGARTRFPLAVMAYCIARNQEGAGRQPCRTLLLAASQLKPARRVAKAGGLPGEGTVYDRITVSNFIDLEKNKLTASLSKSVRLNVFSRLLDADLPTKLTVGGKLGNAWIDGFNFNPVARLGLTIRLLDLGASDSRQAGFLRFKASVRTNGREDHGFEVDRKVAIFNLRQTTLYGNVAYRTHNRANGTWRTASSFGIHQAVRFAGISFAGRIGMTPEGNFVYDLRL